MEAIIAALIAAIVPFLLPLFGTYRMDKEDEALQKSATQLNLRDEAKAIKARRIKRIRKYAQRKSAHFWIEVASVYITLILIGGAVYLVTTFSNPAVRHWTLFGVAAVLSVALACLLFVQLTTVDIKTDNEDKPGKSIQPATTPSDDPDSAGTTAPQDDTTPGHGPDQIRA